MNIRRIVPLAAVGVLAAGAFLPAAAAPAKKPITKSYSMQLLPGGVASCAEADGEGVIVHTETFKASGPGKLVAKITGFEGDWNLAVLNGDNATLADGGGSHVGESGLAPTETLVFKIKKAGTYKVASCNYAGSLNAKGTYTFTLG